MTPTRSRPLNSLLFLLFARHISAYHETPISPDIAWESCSNSSFSFTWQGGDDDQDGHGNQKTGDKLYSGPRLKHNYNGRVSRYEEEEEGEGEGEGDYEVVPGIGQLKPHPLTVSRDQSPTRRRKRAEKTEPSADNTYPELVRALSTSSFLFNRSSGLLNVTQNWVCNSEDEGGFTVNFNASGGVNVSDFGFNYVTDTDSDIIGAHKLSPVKLDIYGDGDGTTIPKRHTSDTGVIDCSAAQNFTVTPYDMRAWTEGEA